MRPLSTKLARRFFGPFEVLEKIGQVAYRLKLPEGSRVHNVFHVSLLKPFVASARSEAAVLPPVFVRGRPVVRPRRVVDRRMVWTDGAAVEEVLLEWGDDEGDQPSWEPLDVVRRRFPHLLLEDKEVSEGGRVVTDQPSARLKETVAEHMVEESDVDTRVSNTNEADRTIARDRTRRQRRPPERLVEFTKP